MLDAHINEQAFAKGRREARRRIGARVGRGRPAAGAGRALDQSDGETVVDGEVGGQEAGQPTADDLHVGMGGGVGVGRIGDRVARVVSHTHSTGWHGET